MLLIVRSFFLFFSFFSFYLSIQVSYAIGVAHPLSVSIFHYGTSQKTERELLDIVNKNFDLRPGVVVRYILVSVCLDAELPSFSLDDNALHEHGIG